MIRRAHILGLVAFFLFIVLTFVYVKRTRRYTNQPSPMLATSPQPAVASQTPTPINPISGVEPPSEFPTVTPTAKPLTPPPTYVGRLNLIIPVAGLRPEQLLDTFTDARSEGRTHDAIDIPAAAGTPVLAATNGEVVKLFQSERGGTTIYQLTPDRKLVLYYAHLQRYADGLAEGSFVRQGDVIAFVGDSGNAGAGNYHLHFSIAILTDPNRYWEGTNINPFPLLRNDKD